MESLYTSEIDAQAKAGGSPSDGRKVKQELKLTNFTIGEKNKVMEGCSEAASQFQKKHKNASQA